MARRLKEKILAEEMSSRSKQTTQVDVTLVFRTPAGDDIEARAAEASAIYEDDALVGFELTLEFSAEVYAQIDKEALFHLDPEARGANLAEPFDPEKPVWITAALSQGLILAIKNNGESVDTLLNNMLQLSGQQDVHPFFLTQNWYALTVKQAVTLPPELAETGDVFAGYSTIWSERENMTENDETQNLQSLFDVVLDFFKIREWPYDQLEGQTTLHMGYSGENGEWDCFAHVNEENQQASFYSVYPAKSNEDLRAAMAELLTRINYGMPVGNFEMDMDDGEIRFKTSLDVTDDRLSLALLTQLFEANLFLMDRYLPAIQSVLKDGAAPVDALGSVED